VRFDCDDRHIASNNETPNPEARLELVKFKHPLPGFFRAFDPWRLRNCLTRSEPGDGPAVDLSRARLRLLLAPRVSPCLTPHVRSTPWVLQP
jgi:hypothetical protein